HGAPVFAGRLGVAETREERSTHRGVGTGRARHRTPGAAVAAIETQDGPSGLGGDLRELRLGLHGRRQAHAAQEVEILVAVRVAEAACQVHALPRRERRDAGRLAAAPQGLADDAAGEASVADLRLRADDVFDSVLARERLD